MPHRDPGFLNEVLDALGGFVYVYDLTTRRNVFVSKRWGTDFGYTFEETRGNEGILERIIHPDDMGAVQAHHQALAESTSDDGRALEYRVWRKDGSLAWVRSLDRPLSRDAEGRVVRIVGQAHDITSEKLAESGRAEGEARFRAIVENLPDAVFIADAKANLLQVNDAACTQLGYTREELEGMRLPDMVAPEFQPRIAERLSTPSGTATARVSAHVRKDGTRVPVETVVVGIEIGGEPAYLGVARDISDRQRLEAQLRDAQRMEAVGRLAGAVAHDFNNILAAILGGASLLERQAQTEEARVIAGEMRTAASRGAELTRQLLTFGRRQPTHLQPIDLAEVVEQTLSVLRRLLDRSIQLRTDLESGCIVMADHGMMDQVVMNLALNARDAMSPGGGVLSISLGQSAAEPGWAELTFTDTGSGIPEADLPNVFEPFFTTKGSGGTGIGLATVYGIVTQHDGRITVESEPGKGSTFRVRLPCARAEEASGLAAAPARPAGTRSLTVLLVDDMKPVRTMVGRLLEVSGHRVIAVDGPDAALAVWDERSAEIDVVLSDVALGTEMDGAALGRKLRERRPDLSVVLMSGFAPEPAGNDTPSDHVFIQKPFSLEELNRLLAKL